MLMCDLFLGKLCVLCGCVVFGEMWLCVFCIFMDFVVFVGVVGIWAKTQIIHFTFVCWMKIACMNLWGSLDLMCDLMCVWDVLSCVVFCVGYFGVLFVVFAHIVLWNVRI